ncbi:hypothetical protein CICLE_v10032935mg [Citrus x clementina]|uniref:Uncharacterized protein n=1 Tax=Citrus clementina TaxID=85681 RepID=V4TEH7_CITCL|nr:hypothetical protein CICLE_v10032935mg [Citrus x clementina]
MQKQPSIATAANIADSPSGYGKQREEAGNENREGANLRVAATLESHTISSQSPRQKEVVDERRGTKNAGPKRRKWKLQARNVIKKRHTEYGPIRGKRPGGGGEYQSQAQNIKRPEFSLAKANIYNRLPHKHKLHWEGLEEVDKEQTHHAATQSAEAGEQPRRQP